MRSERFGEMTELEALKNELAELRAKQERMEAVLDELCPSRPKTDKEIYAEVSHLIQTLGPDRAAEEINRRNRIRRSL